MESGRLNPPKAFEDLEEDLNRIQAHCESFKENVMSNTNVSVVFQGKITGIKQIHPIVRSTAAVDFS
jgi:myosin heavy subunit